MRKHGARSPLIVKLYRHYLDNQDSAGFITRVSRQYTTGTLLRLTEHTQRRVRRASVLALGFLADYDANATLGRALHDPDRAVRMIAENAIRNVWSRAGSEAERHALAIIVRLNAAHRYEDAARRATELIAWSSEFAEAWNQRAVGHFGLEQYEASIRDCHQALELNPYHFGAASGMGLAFLRLGDQVAALECFRRALRLNPDLEGIRVQVARLTKRIEEK